MEDKYQQLLRKSNIPLSPIPTTPMKNTRIQTYLSRYPDMLQDIIAEVKDDQHTLMETAYPPAEIAKDILALEHVVTELQKLQDKLKAM